MDASPNVTAVADVSHEKGLSQPVDAGPSHGAEWGLASLLTGGFLVVGAIIFLHLALTARDIGDRFFNKLDVMVIMSLLSVMTIVVLAVNLLSVLAGLRGVFAARGRRQPIGLGLLGFLLSILALGLWVCACFAGYVVLVSVRT